jgi:hypothetical protein
MLHKCINCNKEYKFSSDYNRHINRKTHCKVKSNDPIIFNCPKCNKTYATNGSLQRHISSNCIKIQASVKQQPQQPQQPQNPQFVKSDHIKLHNDFSCDLCNKTFTRKDTLLRHTQKYCKTVRQQNNHTHAMYDKLAKKIEDMENNMNELKKENQKLKNNKTINNNNTINDNSTTINNNVNIKIVANSTEDLEFITNNDAFKFICRSANSVPELIKMLNFDKDKPENHNMYLPNIGSNTVCVYDGNDWLRTSLYDTLDHILDSKNSYLSNKNDELKEKYSERQQNAVRGFARYLKWYDDDPKYKFKVYTRLKHMLYNHRNMVLDTIKKNEQSADIHPDDNKSIAGQPDDNKSIDGQSDDNKSIDNKSIDNKSIDTQLIDDKLSENQPTDNQPTDNQPTDNQPTDNQPTDNKPVNNLIKELFNDELLDEFIEEFANNGAINSKNKLLTNFIDDCAGDIGILENISNSDDEFIEDSDE